MEQDVVVMREADGGWGFVAGSPPRLLMGKETRDTGGHPLPPSIPKYTESACSSFGRDVSKHFCQVNAYFLLALLTWKHESDIVPLALDPTEVAHHWA